MWLSSSGSPFCSIIADFGYFITTRVRSVVYKSVFLYPSWGKYIGLGPIILLAINNSITFFWPSHCKISTSPIFFYSIDEELQMNMTETRLTLKWTFMVHFIYGIMWYSHVWYIWSTIWQYDIHDYMDYPVQSNNNSSHIDSSEMMRNSWIVYCHFIAIDICYFKTNNTKSWTFSTYYLLSYLIGAISIRTICLEPKSSYLIYIQVVCLHFHFGWWEGLWFGAIESTCVLENLHFGALP